MGTFKHHNISSLALQEETKEYNRRKHLFEFNFCKLRLITKLKYFHPSLLRYVVQKPNWTGDQKNLILYFQWCSLVSCHWRALGWTDEWNGRPIGWCFCLLLTHDWPTGRGPETHWPTGCKGGTWGIVGNYHSPSGSRSDPEPAGKTSGQHRHAGPDWLIPWQKSPLWPGGREQQGHMTDDH